MSVEARVGPPGWLVLLLALSCGLIVANIYIAQPLAGPIAASVGLRPSLAGLVVTASQIGYGLGLLLLVPLGDLVEVRRLVLSIMAAGTLGLLSAALSRTGPAFLLSALLIGVGSVSVQVLVPYAAHLAPPARRGRVVGNVMSGLMLGIMLARPVASLAARLAGWHAVFLGEAAIMLALGLVLRLCLPPRSPPPGPRYLALLGSMAGLAAHTPVLQRRALYHVCLFGCFSLFWTIVPLLLAHRYGLGQGGIALFALVGVAGAVSAPLAGRAADRGWTRPATASALLTAIACFLAMRLAGDGRAGLLLLAGGGVVLDFAVTANLVLGQRAIYALGDGVRSRLNGLYMAAFFCGGAAGSALGGWAYASGGWPSACWLGAVLPLPALAVLLADRPRAARLARG